MVSNKHRRTCSPRCRAASGNIAAGCRAATADDAATAINTAISRVLADQCVHARTAWLPHAAQVPVVATFVVLQASPTLLPEQALTATVPQAATAAGVLKLIPSSETTQV